HTRPLHSRPHALIYLASNLTHRHPWPVPHSPIHPSIPRWQRRVSPSGTSPLLDQRGFHALSATNPPLSTAAEPRHRRCSTCPAARRLHRLRDPAPPHPPPGVEGPHPPLVMPAAWGTPPLLYVGAGKKLAEESGYQVISYTSRGFWDSGGGVEIAGPEDRADASAVIDWALDNTEADPE